MNKVIIIGAGAAGLMASVLLTESGISPIIIEKNHKPGIKLLITGKGRCNITNVCSMDEMRMAITDSPRFLYSAFAAFSNQDLIDKFKKLGLEVKIERGGRVFPSSDRASDVLDCLTKQLKQPLIRGRVIELLVENSAFFGVKLEDGRVIKADACLVATGGITYPKTGSTGDGYRLAENLGHSIISPRGALVALNTHENVEELAGLTLKNVILTAYSAGKVKFKQLGQMLFTHFGISGPLTLSASCYLENMDDYVTIDLKPALSTTKLDSRLLRDFKENSNKYFQNALDGLLPKSLISFFVRKTGIDATKRVNEITREERQKIIELLKGLEFKILGPRGDEEAIITRGGVNVREVSPKTLESKLVKGVFFAGEVLDVAALTGGFNLQIAFSTAFAAASEIIRRINHE